MNTNALHIFLSNNVVTAACVAENVLQIVFSNVHLSNLDTLVTNLTLYHGTKIHLILDSHNIVIKSIDILGMNYWHQYQLSKRLTHETTSDWYSLWKESETLMFIKGHLSDLERAFLQQLEEKHFLIESIVPALWILNNCLLKGHAIKRNGIVHIPLHDHFQQVLFLNGAPAISRISPNTDTTDWIQFVQTKYKITLTSLNAEHLIRSLGNPTDTFPLFALTHLKKSRLPNIVFLKGLSLKKYALYSRFLKQCTYVMASLSIVISTAMAPRLTDMYTRHIKLQRLIHKEQNILTTHVVTDMLNKTSQSYIHKRNVVESFNAHSFPTLSFLEKISTILPNYGQVIYLRLSPKVSNLKASGSDEFSIHLRIVPLKSSKNLQLLTTEIHKAFGSKIRVNIIKNPIVHAHDAKEPVSLKHTIQINLTGLMHDIQRLTP